MSPVDRSHHHPDTGRLLGNEFALVEIGVVDAGNGPALRIRDTDSDRSVLLDPLELEALTRLRHADLGALVVREPDEGSEKKGDGGR